MSWLSLKNQILNQVIQDKERVRVNQDNINKRLQEISIREQAIVKIENERK